MKILKACHLDPTSAHLGVKRTLSRITEKFMWPGVSKDVERLGSYGYFSMVHDNVLVEKRGWCSRYCVPANSHIRNQHNPNNFVTLQ